MISTVAEHILMLPAWAALMVVFALPALECSAFVGFVFPGELALILGGVLAYEGRVSLVAVIGAGIAGAAVGTASGTPSASGTADGCWMEPSAAP